jgi:hypothetical protein
MLYLVSMAAQTVLESQFATLWYRPESRIVHHKIHKFISGAEFRNLLLAGTELLKTHKARKWLSDDRGNSALRQDDLEWSETEWAPTTAKAGWKYWAIVQPEKILGQMALQRLTEKYAQLGVTARIFSDPDAALAWLERQ